MKNENSESQRQIVGTKLIMMMMMKNPTNYKQSYKEHADLQRKLQIMGKHVY